MKTTQLLTAVIVLGLTSALCAQDWPQWRGPERTGRSAETGLLKQWPEDGPKKLWTVKGLGEGYSTISVKDGRIYTMGTSDGGEAVFALEFNSGRQLWVSQSSDRIYNEKRGNGPRGTPTCDGDFVYTEDSFGVVTCLKAADGEKVWQVGLSDLGGRRPHWAYSESPLIAGKAVIVTPGGRRGTIAALDKKTGKVIWQSPDAKHAVAYGSCMLIDVKGKKQIVNVTATGPRIGRRRFGTMIGVDANSGKLLWEFSKGVAGIACGTAVYHDGIVVASSGYGAGTGAADITGGRANELWHLNGRGSHHGGIIRVDDHIYGFIDAMTCIEMKTGKVAWRNRSVGKGSLVYADGHFYCLSERNTVGLVEATPDGYKEKGRFSIPKSGRQSWAHPVVVGGRLFIRDQDTLSCYDVKAK